MRYIASFEVQALDGQVRLRAERAVEINQWSQTYNVIQARDQIQDQVALDLGEQIVVTDIRPA